MRELFYILAPPERDGKSKTEMDAGAAGCWIEIQDGGLYRRGPAPAPAAWKAGCVFSTRALADAFVAREVAAGLLPADECEVHAASVSAPAGAKSIYALVLVDSDLERSFGGLFASEDDIAAKYADDADELGLEVFKVPIYTQMPPP